MERREKGGTEKLTLTAILVVEAVLILAVLLFLLSPLINQVYAVVGANNVTVITLLQVGNVFPEVTSVVINNGTAITLIPNSTVSVGVVAVVRDFNGEADIKNATVVFFHTVTSAYGNADDNNRHYTNSSCIINASYGTIYEANATCILPLQYYAEPGVWNATVIAYDNSSLSDQNSSTITVSSLLALGLPDTIDYGVVNATAVSPEKTVNITNFGNVLINISLQGYAIYKWDNLSMNCTLGTIKNISIKYEKYNMTDSIAGPLTLAQFEANYTNMTSTSAVIRKMNIPYRQNDAAPFTDDTNATYWRMYVPMGVAGTCQGNIVFGAVQSGGLG